MIAADLEQCLRKWARNKEQGVSLCSGSLDYALSNVAEIAETVFIGIAAERRVARATNAERNSLSALGRRILAMVEKSANRKGFTPKDAELESVELADVIRQIEAEGEVN